MAAALGPAELFIFRWFAPGGRFAYDGFNFGSFMFASMTAQILGYYTIAAVFIPLGIGHLTLKRWVRPLALGLFGFWLVLGLPLILIVMAIALGSKELPLAVALLFALVLLACYFVLPWVFLRFYRSSGLRQVLEAGEPEPHWLESVPVVNLVVAFVLIFIAIMLHVAVLLNGVFPLFGRFVYGLPGALLLDFLAWSLVTLAWGAVRRWRWAWWGALALCAALAVSVIWSFWATSYFELLAGMQIPSAELEFLDGVPAQGWHFALFLGLPLLATLGLVVFARADWLPRDPA
jgi:hypothetical protein